MLQRLKQIESDDQEVSVPALYRYLAACMSEAGLGFRQTRPLDCLDDFEKQFPGIDAAEYQRVVNLHQAFAFGGHQMKPNEMRTLRRFASRLHDALPKPHGLIARIKRAYVKAL